MMVSMLAGSQGASGDELHVIKIISTYAAVMFSWMAGVFAAGDICYDGSALGTQILTGASGRDDRLGRSMAILFLTVPVQLVFIVGFTLYTGMWEQLPGVIGIAACMLLGGCGVGVLVSSFWQYSQPPAGGNMFGKGSTGGVAGFIVAMLSLFVPIIACAPSIILSVVANVTGHLVIFGLISMVVGIGIGACILWFGISIGGKQLDNSWPEVLDRVTWKN
jgi:ABC-2 type transport system permease protein